MIKNLLLLLGAVALLFSLSSCMNRFIYPGATGCHGITPPALRAE